MPELFFRVRWPDRSTTDCYSPSRVVGEYLAAGESYTMKEFVARSTRALAAASERVRVRHGFACGRAARQAAEIEAAATRFTHLPEARVLVEWIGE